MSYWPIITLRVPPEVLAKLDEAAARIGLRRRSAVVRMAIDKFLGGLYAPQRQPPLPADPGAVERESPSSSLLPSRESGSNGAADEIDELLKEIEG